MQDSITIEPGDVLDTNQEHTTCETATATAPTPLYNVPTTVSNPRAPLPKFNSKRFFAGSQILETTVCGNANDHMIPEPQNLASSGLENDSDTNSPADLLPFEIAHGDTDADPRPTWEPPEFDYAHFERWLLAQKETKNMRRLGTSHGEIANHRALHKPSYMAWRTTALDNIIESELLQMHMQWAEKSSLRAQDNGREADVPFFEALQAELSIDWEELDEETEDWDVAWGANEGETYYLKYAIMHRPLKDIGC